MVRSQLYPGPEHEDEDRGQKDKRGVQLDVPPMLVEKVGEGPARVGQLAHSGDRVGREVDRVPLHHEQQREDVDGPQPQAPEDLGPQSQLDVEDDEDEDELRVGQILERQAVEHRRRRKDDRQQIDQRVADDEEDDPAGRRPAPGYFPVAGSSRMIG